MTEDNNIASEVRLISEVPVDAAVVDCLPTQSAADVSQKSVKQRCLVLSDGDRRDINILQEGLPRAPACMLLPSPRCQSEPPMVRIG